MTNKEHLSFQERIFLILLGLPSLGIALAYTLITIYLPIFIEKLSGAAITGLMIGGESIFSLFVPFIVGVLSDASESRFGKRIPYIFIGTILIVFSLLFLPLASNKLALLGLGLALFFIGYYVFYTPYYALFPDLVPKEESGRSQGIQGGFRSLGMLLSLVGGGILIDIWKPLPFLIVSLIMLSVNGVFYFGVRSRIKRSAESYQSHKAYKWLTEWTLIQGNPKIKYWFIANTLWESSISTLKVFVVLYFLRALHFSLTQSAEALSLVGVAAIFAAPIAGKLVDQYGHKPVILTAAICFALGLLPPLFSTDIYFVAGILPVAFASVVLMTLPYSLLMQLLPDKNDHGAGAALFGLSQGLGTVIGPSIAGIAIELSKYIQFGEFALTKGFVAIFPVSCFFIVLSIPFSLVLFKKLNENLKQEAS